MASSKIIQFSKNDSHNFRFCYNFISINSSTSVYSSSYFLFVCFFLFNIKLPRGAESIIQIVFQNFWFMGTQLEVFADLLNSIMKFRPQHCKSNIFTYFVSEKLIFCLLLVFPFIRFVSIFIHFPPIS